MQPTRLPSSAMASTTSRRPTALYPRPRGHDRRRRPRVLAHDGAGGGHGLRRRTVRGATYWLSGSGGWLTYCCLDWIRCDAPTSRQSAGARLAALGAERLSSRRGTATNSAQLTNAADPTQLA